MHIIITILLSFITFCAFAAEPQSPALPVLPTIPNPVDIPPPSSVPQIPAMSKTPVVSTNTSSTVDTNITTITPPNNGIPSEVKVPDINVTIPNSDTIPTPAIIPEATLPKTEEPNLAADPTAKHIDTLLQKPEEVTLHPQPEMPKINPEDKPVKAEDVKQVNIPPVQSKLKAKKTKKEEKKDSIFQGLLPKSTPKKEVKPQITRDQAIDIDHEKHISDAEEVEKIFNLNYKNKVLPKKLFYDPNSKQNKHLAKPVSTKDYIFASFIAIQNDDIDSLRNYSQDIGNLNFPDDDGNTPIFYAIVYNARNAFDWILAQKGVDLNIQNKFGATPLHTAIIAGDVDFVKALISNKNIKIDIRDQNGKIAQEYIENLSNDKQKKIISILKKYKKYRSLDY